jgi:hypothetical protein
MIESVVTERETAGRMSRGVLCGVGECTVRGRCISPSDRLSHESADAI